MVKQLISKKEQILSMTTNAHLKYIRQANPRYPQRHNDSRCGVKIGSLPSIKSKAEGLYILRSGRLISAARRMRGIIRLVKYGKGCFVRCAYEIRISSGRGVYENDFCGHSTKDECHC
jgi:hypothetical protein